MLFLTICLMLWDLSNGAAIKKTHPSPWNDAKDWWKNLPTDDWVRFTFDRDKNKESTLKPSDWDWSKESTVKPLDWDWNKESTVKPLDWDWNKQYTVKPSDWDWNKESAVKPFDWYWKEVTTQFDWDWYKKYTFKPIDWDKFDRYTSSPNDDYSYKRSRGLDSGLMLAIFLPTAIGIFLIIICKYLVCRGDESSDSSGTRTLHPPPRTIEPPPSRIESLPQTRIVYTPEGRQIITEDSRRSRRQELVYTVPSSNPVPVMTNTSSNMNTVADKPPAYGAVVMADFDVGQTSFPAVRPVIPETPPPQYDDNNLMKY